MNTRTSPPESNQEPHRPEQPLSMAWREWLRQQSPPPTERDLRLINKKAKEREEAARDSAQALSGAFDAIVVGSGYGGSVAALRLAQKGYRVLVLERGSEYLPGDFPNDFARMPKYVRANVPGRGLPMGRASGLFELTLGQGIAAITGNGLGGGSLINAGVVIEPDADVFTQEAWPAAIRHGMGPKTGESDLKAAFHRARETLGVRRYVPPAGMPALDPSLGRAFSSDGPNDKRLPLKAEALLNSAQALQQRRGSDKPLWTPADLTINSEQCRQCGDCASGCNVPGAKGDLRSTYLQQAVATGRVQAEAGGRVQILTQAEVYRFEQERESSGQNSQASPSAPTGRWKVWVFATDSQHEKMSRREAGHERDIQIDPASTLRILCTQTLVISAGTLGSTQLLQRSQAYAGEHLAFSPALGTRLSGNGDSISALAGQVQRVNAVGHGSDEGMQNLSKDRASDHAHIVGPTITGMLDLRHADQPLDQRLLLQDAAIPGALSRIFEELVATTQTLAQTDRWAFQTPPPLGHLREPSDPLAASTALGQHTQVWLAMGHDHSPGRMVWMPSTDGSAMVMPEPQELETYKQQQRLFERLQGQGIHLHNPLWKALPDSASTLMSGAKTHQMVTTVHPLGGCPMGDDPLTSVVNHLGQVWVHEPGFPGRTPPENPVVVAPNAPSVYGGLYVLDGSIVPTSLGCNPLLTITALAERAMVFAPPLPCPWPPMVLVPLHADCRPSVRYVHKKVALDATLHETLRAQSQEFSGRWSIPTDQGKPELLFTASLATEDLEKTLAQKDHRFQISTARLELGRRGTDNTVVQQAAYELDAEGGPAEFHFLPATDGGSSGYLPLWRAVGSTLLCLTVFVGGLLVAWEWATQCEWIIALKWLGAAALGTLFWVVLLAFPRTVLTWFLLRGWFDLPRQENPGNRLWKAFQQMVHSLEKRVMHYRVPLHRNTTGPNAEASPAFPDRIVLEASKVVMYRASLVELLRWAWLGMRPRRWRPRERAALRPSYWEQLMDAHATVRSKCNHVHQAGSEQVLFKGRLKMGFEGLFNQDAMQMGQRGDTTTGLLLLSGYALLALRFAIKTRLYDFRLPSYADRPVADQADKHDMALRRANGLPALAPDMHRLEVPRGSSNSDQGTESTEPLTLPLWRYRQLGADQTPQIPDVQLIEEEGGESPRVHKVKAVLLLHAFGQSGLSYTYKDPESSCGSNLAEAFYAQGYEVWLLDSRMSSRSGYAELAQTVDMQGEHDVPCAVDHILKTLQTELRLSEETTCLQISVFAQCIGAAALWMAALSGRLSHPTLGRHGLPIPKLSAAMFSQVHALIQGMPLTRSKVWLPALLEKVLPFIPFAVRGAQNGLLWQWTDRLLSSMPVPEAERKLTDDEDGLATCRRIRFIEAPLFKHENMRPGTVQDMNRLFGPANLRLFGHARRFVEYERLVDEDGFNRYVNDKNLHDHLNFPIQLLHGEDNELFDVAGARKTFEWLKRRPSCVPQEEAPLIIKGYGHLDVLLGHNAARDVFAPVLDFFSQAHGSSPPQTVCAAPSARWRVAAPRVGPLVGWVRREGTDLVVRLSIAIDDLHGGSTEDGDTHILVRRSDGAGSFLLHIADAKFVPLKHPGMSESTAPEAVALRCAQIDVRLHPTQYAGACQAGQALAFQVMSLHKILAPPATTQSLWISTNALGPLDLVKTALAPGWQRRLPSAFPWVAAQHLLNGQIAQALAADQAEVDAHNQVAELDGLRKRASVLERVAFSVPVATCHALLSNAEPGPSHGVSFLASCCRHPGLTVDRNRIDEALAHVQNARDRKAPAFALLVGDQIYADATAGLVDPTSPVERYLERYETALTAAPMRRFLAHMPTFMTPDDHEWTNNYPHAAPLHIRAWPDWGYEGSFRGVNGAWATWARASMRSFQRLQGPFATGKKKHAHQYGVGNFGPVRVFVIDTRQRRHRGLPEVVVNQTFNDLQRWLCAGSKDVLNVVVTGSVLLPGLHADADPANPGAMDTWQSAPDQRQRALDMLVRRCVGTPHRFLLVSGDYHVSVALQIRVGSETHSTVVGAAVVVPPLYAPMPYVNSCPEHLWLDEPLAVAGQALELVVPQNGEPRVGSGLAHITVGCTAAGFKISVHRELQVFEQGLLPSNTASTAVFTV